MKTRIQSLALIMFIAGTVFTSNRIYSQCSALNVIGPFFGPGRYEVQSPNGFICLTQGPGTCPQSAGALFMPGLGVNQNNPQFMVDILCDPTNGTKEDVNISCLKCTPVNSVGYRIDSNYVIWTDGDITSLYTGVGAGFGVTNTLSSTNYHNTFAGYKAG
jgi:hypothetical protein